MSESSSESQSKEHYSFDPQREHLGNIYAKGLLGAAAEANVTERVFEQLDSLIDDVFERLPDFEHLLASPRIALSEKHRVLDQAFAGRMEHVLLTFLKVAARHERLDCLRQIRAAFRELYYEMTNRIEVTVETAAELSADLRDQVEQRLTTALGRQVELCVKVNPELLGGMIVRVADTVYDGSLQHRLDTMCSDTLARTAQQIRDSLQRFVVSQ